MERHAHIAAVTALLLSGCGGDGPAELPGTEPVDGRVRLAVSLSDPDLMRDVCQLPEVRLTDWSVLLSGKTYPVTAAADGSCYVDVEASAFDTYHAALVRETSSRWYGDSPYYDLVMPPFQCPDEDYPLFAYAEDGKLSFAPPWGLVEIRPDAGDTFLSLHVASPSAPVSGTGNYLRTTGEWLPVAPSTEAACVATPDGRFLLRLPPGSYPDGFRLTVCDAAHHVGYAELPSLEVSAGKRGQAVISWQPEPDILYYDAFDTEPSSMARGGTVLEGLADDAMDDCTVRFRVMLEEGAADRLRIRIEDAGLITACTIDDKPVPVSYVTLTGAVSVPNLSRGVWHTVEATVVNATDATRLSLTGTAGEDSGVLVDDIVCTRTSDGTAGGALRLLYWNLQNGMWADQADGYDHFVDFVRRFDPDICVWCEAGSVYADGTADLLPASGRYLPSDWDALAACYGHPYTALSAVTDNYPEAVTSRYPVTVVEQIPDAVRHGAGHFRITAGDRDLDIVPLHLWPAQYAPGLAESEREASAAAGDGDRFRLGEITALLGRTVLDARYAAVQDWILVGDFNARSRADNWHLGYAEDASQFLVHDYMAAHSGLVDLFAVRYPDFFLTTMTASRIDFVYASPALAEVQGRRAVVVDNWTAITDAGVATFKRPSDHRPLLIDFAL